MRQLVETACARATAAIPIERGRRRFTRPLALAAAIVLLITGSWMIWRTVGPQVHVRDPYDPQEYRSMVTVYHDALAGDFKPDWVCRDDIEFRETFGTRFGQGLLLRARHEDHEIIRVSNRQKHRPPRPTFAMAELADSISGAGIRAAVTSAARPDVVLVALLDRRQDDVGQER